MLLQISQRTACEVAWLAGLIEGEGYIHVIKSTVNGKSYYYPRIHIRMTDKDVVERVAEMWGNSVQAIKPGPQSHLTSYGTQISGSRAVEWMMVIRPYMGKRKKEQIASAIEAHEQKPDANELRRSWSSASAASRKRDEKGRLI